MDNLSNWKDDEICSMFLSESSDSLQTCFLKFSSFQRLQNGKK